MECETGRTGKIMLLAARDDDSGDLLSLSIQLYKETSHSECLRERRYEVLSSILWIALRERDRIEFASSSLLISTVSLFSAS